MADSTPSAGWPGLAFVQSIAAVGVSVRSFVVAHRVIRHLHRFKGFKEQQLLASPRKRRPVPKEVVPGRDRMKSTHKEMWKPIIVAVWSSSSYAVGTNKTSEC